MARDSDSLRGASQRLDTILRELDAHPDPGVGRRLREAVALLLDVHGEGLARVMALGSDAALGGAALVARLADDAIVGPLLVVHRLHPYVMEVRAARALDRLRPQIAANGCRAAIAEIGDGRVRVTLEGGARLADAGALRRTIEERLIEAAPELTAVVIENGEAGAGARADAASPPLLQITRRPARRLGAEYDR